MKNDHYLRHLTLQPTIKTGRSISLHSVPRANSPAKNFRLPAYSIMEMVARFNLATSHVPHTEGNSFFATSAGGSIPSFRHFNRIWVSCSFRSILLIISPFLTATSGSTYHMQKNYNKCVAPQPHTFVYCLSLLIDERRLHAVCLFRLCGLNLVYLGLFYFLQCQWIRFVIPFTIRFPRGVVGVHNQSVITLYGFEKTVFTFFE